MKNDDPIICVHIGRSTWQGYASENPYANPLKAATDDMPERIWLSPEGVHLPYQPTMHWEWQEYRRIDLCASGQQMCDARRDIRILLAQIDWLLECTGETLAVEDEALVHQIRRDWSGVAPAAPQHEGQDEANIRWWNGEATHDEIRAVAECATALSGVSVAEALREIRAAVQDANLSKGVRLDIIDKIALSALKGADQ